MRALFAAISLPYLRANAGRLLLTVLGVVIGVQGMVAMGALNHSIVRSFQAGVDVIAGAAALQVTGPTSGIPEELVETIATIPGVNSAFPIIQGTFETTTVPPARVAIFGIDLVESAGHRNPQFPREHVHIDDELVFLNAGNSIAFGQPLLDQLQLELGSPVKLVTSSGPRTFIIRGTLDPVGPMHLFEGMVALLDLPTAQAMILAPGLVQTIYVTGDPSVSIDELQRRIQNTIGERANVERTTVRGEQIEAMLGSLRVALSLANLVTMIVAFFIIFQTVSIAVEQRRREIAIARALGFTKRSIGLLFLTECSLVGIVGATGGLLGGYLLARFSLQAAVVGISQMYLHIAVADLSLPIGEIALAVGFGIGTCIAAGLIPAMAASRDAPAAVLRSTAGVRDDPSNRTLLLMASVVLLVSIVTLSICPRFETSTAKIAWTMLGHALLLVGSAIAATPFVTGWAKIGHILGARAALPTGLATEFFARHPRRAAATVSAIMVGYVLVLVLGSVVHSIERTLGGWLATRFSSDVLISLPPGLDSGSFDQGLVSKIASMPGIKQVERYRKGLAYYDDKPIVLAAYDRKGRPDGAPLTVIQSKPDAYALASAGRGIFVSDSFAFRHGHRLGDTVDLHTAKGVRPFEVVGVVRDYALDLGTILVDIDVYQNLWEDTGLTNANVWPSSGANVSALREEIAHAISADPRVSVVTNVEFREEVQNTIQGLLGVLGSLRIFACAIAMLGVVTFLLAAVLDRRRDIAVLRSIGVTRVQIRQAVMIEAAMLGFVGGCLGLIAGFVASYYMVTHSIRVDMGWTLDFAFPLGLAASTLVAITFAAACAGWFPARQFTTRAILPGLQTE